MSLKAYSRTLNKKLTQGKINESFSEIIEEELETEYWNKGWSEALDEYYETESARASMKSDFALNYLEEKNFPECKNCSYSECNLTNNFYECGEIGIAIKEDYANGDIQIYSIKNIPKYTWMNTGDCFIKVTKGKEKEFLIELSGKYKDKFLE